MKVLLTKITREISGTDIRTSREKWAVLTQNYHVVYQCQDDPGTYSPASKETGQICNNYYKTCLSSGPRMMYKKGYQEDWERHTYKHSIFLSVVSLEVQHCILALLRSKIRTSTHQ